MLASFLTQESQALFKANVKSTFMFHLEIRIVPLLSEGKNQFLLVAQFNMPSSFEIDGTYGKQKIHLIRCVLEHVKHL